MNPLLGMRSSPVCRDPFRSLCWTSSDQSAKASWYQHVSAIFTFFWFDLYFASVSKAVVWWKSKLNIKGFDACRDCVISPSFLTFRKVSPGDHGISHGRVSVSGAHWCLLKSQRREWLLCAGGQLCSRCRESKLKVVVSDDIGCEGRHSFEAAQRNGCGSRNHSRCCKYLCHLCRLSLLTKISWINASLRFEFKT